MVRLLGLIIGLALWLEPVQAGTVAPNDAYLTVEAEQLGRDPFEQEMLLLTVRGFYFIPIALQKLAVPEFRDFGWMTLGRDRWFDTMIDGRKMRVFERDIAVFPKHRGNLTIESFTHQLTLIGQDGKRFTHEIRSPPLMIKAARKPEGVIWWLPARSMAMIDQWDKPPDRLSFGDSAQRTITLKATGIGPETMPPIPKMGGRGLIAFPDPEDRSVELTPQGPVATVTWRWTVRMLSPQPGPLETSPVEWFDTTQVKKRQIAFAPQTVKLASDLAAAPVTAKSGNRIWMIYAVPAGFLFGLMAGLALLLPGWRLKSWAEISKPFRRPLPRAKSRALHQAARNGDAAAMWKIVHNYKTPGTEQLSRSIFASGNSLSIDLPKLARQIAMEISKLECGVVSFSSQSPARQAAE